MQTDTISAIATAVGEGGIGIIRMSGGAALEIIARIFLSRGKESAPEIPSHRVMYGTIVDPASGAVVDEVILLTMRAPNSYTKEDVAEIQCHGGMMAMKSILALTLRQGARLAEPGEFTKRAFLNGRLDLMQAQAVIDVIRSKTDASLRMASGHLSGVFSQKIHQYRHSALEMIASLEAAIDFPEDDIDDIAIEEVEEKLRFLREEIENLLATADKGRILRDGLETAIIGTPNVGKSSLLNTLLNEERAIVTDVPGTTRDSLEEYVNIGGVPLRIIDTAGIRATEDIVERIGVAKAQACMERADLILLLLDASRTLSKEDEEILSLAQGRRVIVLASKADLAPRFELAAVRKFLPDCRIIDISTVTGEGIDQLKLEIVDLVYQGEVQQGEGAFVSNVRQAELLRQAMRHIDEVLATIDLGMAADFIVIDLRNVWEKLGELTGDTVGEDIIDQIFSQFCIGK